ncbi:MAG: hypothetical protein LQ351_007850 [Letrouitia transgressa]|nr:MAG: hypothetical protein LQ351_007850 [Letrouitia transgressa]
MEELLQKHRQEQRDLQSRITQKKKSATKKTRKGVNDECAELERQLLKRQKSDLAVLTGDSSRDESIVGNGNSSNAEDDATSRGATEVDEQLKTLSISASTPSQEATTKKPNRQKARLARRAAEQQAAAENAAQEAKNLPDLREQERVAMRREYTSRGLKEREIRSDGHCLYAAVADQLILCGLSVDLGIESNRAGGISEETVAYKVTRKVTANYITHHKDDFLPFLEEPLDKYVQKIRETGEWGGHLELMALARAYIVDINILQSNGKVEKIECGATKPKQSLWLSYYHHNFGLGEHYNSLPVAA